MKLIKECELCMLRNFIQTTVSDGLLPPAFEDTADDMLKIVEHTLNKETINGHTSNS